MISVIIPALNESARIGGVIALAKRCPEVTEVIVVDDGSIDGTAELAAAEGARVLTSSLLGKGASMEDGLRAGEADIATARFRRAAGRVTTLTARPLLHRADRHGRLQADQIREVEEVERHARVEFRIATKTPRKVHRLALLDMDGPAQGGGTTTIYATATTAANAFQGSKPVGMQISALSNPSGVNLEPDANGISCTGAITAGGTFTCNLTVKTGSTSSNSGKLTTPV